MTKKMMVMMMIKSDKTYHDDTHTRTHTQCVCKAEWGVASLLTDLFEEFLSSLIFFLRFDECCTEMLCVPALLRGTAAALLLVCVSHQSRGPTSRKSEVWHLNVDSDRFDL